MNLAYFRLYGHGIVFAYLYAYAAQHTIHNPQSTIQYIERFYMQNTQEVKKLREIIATSGRKQNTNGEEYVGKHLSAEQCNAIREKINSENKGTSLFYDMLAYIDQH